MQGRVDENTNMITKGRSRESQLPIAKYKRPFKKIKSLGVDHWLSQLTKKRKKAALSSKPRYCLRNRVYCAFLF